MTFSGIQGKYLRMVRAIGKRYSKKFRNAKGDAEIRELQGRLMQEIHGAGSIFKKRVRITPGRDGRPHLDWE